MEGFFRSFAELRVMALDLATARTAARLRAQTGLALPDAAVVATALENEAPIVVTNDARWRGALQASSMSTAVCLLADYSRG
jgi:PIN domain nuclease of toxin-antitoxin system